MAKSPEGFNIISKTIFSPIYPEIARRMLSWSGQVSGLCCDLGTGPGMLAIAVARQCRHAIYAVDNDPDMVSIACKNIMEASLGDRIIPLTADVHCLPLKDGSVDLAVSRGSIPFWEDRCGVFAEIERILGPGGVAYIGGGFGNAGLEKQIFTTMRQKNPDWDADVQRRSRWADPISLEKELKKSGISLFRVIRDESGTWVEIRKR